MLLKAYIYIYTYIFLFFVWGSLAYMYVSAPCVCNSCRGQMRPLGIEVTDGFELPRSICKKQKNLLRIPSRLRELCLKGPGRF